MSNAEYQNFLKTTTVNINGDIVDHSNASISVFDRGFLYGDSIYEVTYSEDGHLIFLEEHIDRLFNSAELLNMEVFISRAEIKAQMMKTLKHSQINSAYIRFILTRGETEISLDPNISFHNNYIIIVKPKPYYDPSLYQKGLFLIVSDVLRNDRRSTNPNAKSGNYLNNVMAIKQAKSLGADDAIMVNKDGEITEGTTFNIWCVHNNVLYTPPEKSGLLKGITRQKVIEIAHENSIEINLEGFNKNFLLNADEVFITSSTKGLMPVKKIDDKVYPPEPSSWKMLSTLQSLYQQKIEYEISRSDNCYL